MPYPWLKNILFAFGTTLFLSACPVQTPQGEALAADGGQPGTIAMRTALYQHLQEFGSVGIAGNRDASHFPENVLSQLHTFFSEGRGLKRMAVEGHQALLLKRFPETVEKQVEEIAFPESFPSGFELLQASFWRQVSDAQKQGVTVGFLEPDESFNVSGVFFQDYNHGHGLLLFDVFAGQGTFTHEYRHYLQAKAFEKREEMRAWDDAGPGELTDSCLAAAIVFFGELDSTTTELPSWIGVFQTLETNPGWHLQAVKGAKDPIRFPQIFMMVTNLDYPGRSAMGLDGQGCPPELLEAAAKIKGATDAFENKITSSYTSKLLDLRMEDFHDHVFLNSSCAATSEDCERRQQLLLAIPGQAKEAKDGADSMLRQEAIDRPARNQAVLSALPDPVKSDLCHYAKAFEFLIPCPKENAP